MRRAFARSRLCVIGIALGLTLAACTAAPTPEPTATSAPAPEPTGDGVLRVGTLLPASGALADQGAAQIAAVEVAVREINEAGGVLGAPVEVLHRDSGDETTTTAESSLADLLSRGVDVVIGPVVTGLVDRLDAGDIALVPVMDAGLVADDALTARLLQSDPALSSFPLVVEVYDATIRAALAAVLAADDGGPSVAAASTRLDGSGVPCTSFGECVSVLATESAIRYSSPFAVAAAP